MTTMLIAFIEVNHDEVALILIGYFFRHVDGHILVSGLFGLAELAKLKSALTKMTSL